MRPLRECNSPSSELEAQAVELLRSVARHQPTGGAKQRVRIRLLERTVAPRRFVPRRMLVLALWLGAAGASAAIGTPLVRRTLQVLADGPRTEIRSVSEAVRSRVVGGRLGQSRAAVGIQVTTVDGGIGAVDSDRLAQVRSTVPVPATRTTVQSPEAARLVFDAMRLLRREGRADRASVLLGEYLRTYPGGPLAEEALALAIEAAVALGDRRAKDLANRYLARYPNGQFRAAAERARARY